MSIQYCETKHPNFVTEYYLLLCSIFNLFSDSLPVAESYKVVV